MVQNMYGDGTIGALTRSVRAEEGLDMNECGRRPIKRCADWSGAAVGDRDGKSGKTKCGEGGRKVGGKEERTQQEEGRTNSNQSTLRTHQQAAAEKQDAFHLSAP